MWLLVARGKGAKAGERRAKEGEMGTSVTVSIIIKKIGKRLDSTFELHVQNWDNVKRSGIR